MFKNHKVNNIEHIYIFSNCVNMHSKNQKGKHSAKYIPNGKVIKTSKNPLFDSQNLFGSWDSFKFFGQNSSISKAQRLKLEKCCDKYINTVSEWLLDYLPLRLRPTF